MNFLKLLFLLIFICSNSYAECLRAHLLEAQKLNELRKPMYSKLTNKESEKISELMIEQEQFARYATVILLPFAHYFRSRNIPLLCEEFVSMSLTKKFQSKVPSKPISENYLTVNTKALQKRLYTSLDEGFVALGQQSAKEVLSFKDSAYNCMTKHILESLARSAFLSEKYVLEAQKQNLFFSPNSLLKFSLKAQIDSLEKIKNIDVWSSTIQKKGIPIICNDVPEIPIRSQWGA